MTLMTHQHIGRTRDAIEMQEIASRLGIPLTAITVEMRWEYAMGNMDEGASEHWPRFPQDYYRPVVRGLASGGAYPIAAFPDPTSPQPLPDLLTEGMDDDA